MKIARVKIPTGRRQTSWLYTELVRYKFGTPKTNPSGGREENLNPGPPDYKSSALSTRPRSPPPQAGLFDTIIFPSSEEIYRVCMNYVHFELLFELLLLFLLIIIPLSKKIVKSKMADPKWRL